LARPPCGMGRRSMPRGIERPNRCAGHCVTRCPLRGAAVAEGRVPLGAAMECLQSAKLMGKGLKSRIAESRSRDIMAGDDNKQAELAGSRRGDRGRRARARAGR
jgi:hypothetical protein